jgi:hypothetical protein
MAFSAAIDTKFKMAYTLLIIIKAWIMPNIDAATNYGN